MKKLILTEKPSVARDFASHLKAASRQGHFENDNYVICSALGHLVTIVDPEEYDPSWKRWSLASLPIIPAKTKFKVIKKTAKQFAIIKKQLQRRDVASVIIATDAGREGEYIARLILQQAGCTKPLQRFWVSQALSPAVIQKGMTNLKPASEYLGHFYSAAARSVGDWLVGMNGTRGLTKAMGGDLISVGRVQTPTLALIVDRHIQRRDFIPETFMRLRATFSHVAGEYQGLYRRIEDGQIKRRFFTAKGEHETLSDIAAAIEKESGIIGSVSTKEKRELPPRLFSLTALQRRANQRFGFSASKTLSLAQELYERDKILSYPRSDAEVMGEDNVDLVRESLNALRPHFADKLYHINRQRIDATYRRNFNSAALSDHHALIPLGFKEGLGGDKAKLMQLVVERFIAAFCDDYCYRSSEIITEIKGHQFESRGSTPTQPGWKAVEPPPKKRDDQSQLPAVNKGEAANVIDTECESDATKPPPSYNEASLLGAMERPSTDETDDDTLQSILKEAGLGTPATRASIIETLFSRNYISRRGKELHPEAKGIALIEYLRGLKAGQSLTNPLGTAEMEQSLAEIVQQKGDPARFVDQIKGFASAFVEELKTVDGATIPAELRQSSGPQKRYGKTKQYGKSKGAPRRKTAAKKLESPCPLCSKPLVQRSYKDKRSGGERSFVGCSGYPHCRYTQSAKKD